MTENVLKPDKSDPAWSWLALSLISGSGYKKIRNLIEHTGSVEDLLKTRPEILIEQFKCVNVFWYWISLVVPVNNSFHECN